MSSSPPSCYYCHWWLRPCDSQYCHISIWWEAGREYVPVPRHYPLHPASWPAHWLLWRHHCSSSPSPPLYSPSRGNIYHTVRTVQVTIYNSISHRVSLAELDQLHNDRASPLSSPGLEWTGVCLDCVISHLWRLTAGYCYAIVCHRSCFHTHWLSTSRTSSESHISSPYSVHQPFIQKENTNLRYKSE